MGKGPLHENEIFGVDRVDGSRQLVARVYGYSAEEVRANMRRITACVRACQGIPTGVLEAGAVVVPEDDARLMLRDAEEENRRLRERVTQLEDGIMRVLSQLGGDSHDSESVRQLPVGQTNRR